MESYIGTKIVQAEPMDNNAFVCEQGKSIPNTPDEPGYKVLHDNHYTSWSPKDIFEAAYRKISDDEKQLIE